MQIKHFISASILLVCLLFSKISYTQKTALVSGPMLGHIEFRSANVWFEVNNETESYTISLSSKEDMRFITPKQYSQSIKYNQYASFTPVTHTFYNLEPNKKYTYTINLKSKKGFEKNSITGDFSTLKLWAFRTPAPDFSFLTGSCNFVNEPVYDRPGKPYGNDSTIFLQMAKDSADFMLWLGDNWYYREADYGSVQGLYYRASRDRSQQTLQPLLKKMPHYAIWDDHDFGDNDSYSGFIFNKESRNLFKQYWANPSYGEDEKGIYTTFWHSDAQFILLDDRTFRSSDNLLDSVNNQPNINKQMWGEKQLNWLYNALANSRATFKFIVTGSQVLNENSPYDCACHFSYEYQQLLNFIVQNKIEGVVFLTGDRHHSEVIKKQIKGFYTLYDITSSPLTSGSHLFNGTELNNPLRIVGVENKQNYSRITITGAKKQRTLHITFKDSKGNNLAIWSISENDLKVPH